jgi:hypothetical protein
MNVRGPAFRKLCSWLACGALALAAPAAAWAQCAMCKTSAENMDAAGIKYLNIATLLLLSPPVAMFCGFFYLAYKRRNAPGGHERGLERVETAETELGER